jgi:hypothetical protein
LPATAPECGTALPYGLSPDGRLMHVAEVPSGLACWCRCPRCGVPLVARKGAVVAPHFAHAGGGRACDPGAAWETALHRLAKQVIQEARELLLPEAVAEVELGGSDGVLREVVAPATLFRYDGAETEVGLGGLRPDAVLRRVGATPEAERSLLVEFAVTHFCSAEKTAELRRRGLACVEVDLSGVPRLATRDEHVRAILHEAPRRWLSNARIEQAEAQLRAAAQARAEAEGAERKRQHARLIPGLIAAWAVPPRPRDPAWAVWARDAGLGEAVGVPVAGQGVFVGDPATWQAMLLHLLCTAASGGSRFDGDWALQGLRESGALKVPFAAVRVWSAELVSDVQGRLEGFRPPPDMVANYCGYLAERGVLVPVSGDAWRIDPERVREVRARLVAARAARAREAELVRRVTAVLAAAAGAGATAAVVPQSWMDTPLAGLGASPGAIARVGGSGYEALLRRLGALARMARPGGDPVRGGLLGLPLAAVAHVRAEEARQRERQRRERVAGAAARSTAASVRHRAD